MARQQPICDVLPHTEFQYMTETFGENVYRLLKDDLSSTVGATKWNDESNYMLDAVVSYQGIYYKLIVAANTSNDAPNCSTDWRVVDKFNTACYNNLWNVGDNKGGLKKLLAWVVYAKAVPFYPNILGVTDFIGTDEKYKEKIQYHLGGVYSNIQMMYKQLIYWNQKNTCITIYECESGSAGAQLNKAVRTTAW